MTIQSSFTTTYPRLHRSHAVRALHQLNDFVVLDCETTGIGKSAEVIEIAIVDYKSGEVLFNSLLRPYKLHLYETSDASKINGITSQELNNAPTILQVWPEVVGILQSKPITAFNTDFDLRTIRNSAFKWNIEAPILEATCIMKIATAFLNLDFWVSLDEAASLFGIKSSGAHRALADVMTTIGVVKAMKESRHG